MGPTFIMAVRLEFKDEVVAKKAMHDCLKQGYWGIILPSDKSRKAACILECHELIAEMIEIRYQDYIL